MLLGSLIYLASTLMIGIILNLKEFTQIAWVMYFVGLTIFSILIMIGLFDSEDLF